MDALKQNGYSHTFIGSSLPPPPRDAEEDQEPNVENTEGVPLVVLPYIAGVNEDIM